VAGGRRLICSLLYARRTLSWRRFCLTVSLRALRALVPSSDGQKLTRKLSSDSLINLFQLD